MSQHGRGSFFPFGQRPPRTPSPAPSPTILAHTGGRRHPAVAGSEPVPGDTAAVLRGCPLAEARADAEELPAASLLPSCPHLGAVYDVLLAAVAGADGKSLRAHADRCFCTALLVLVASKDPHDTPSSLWSAPLHGERPPPVRQHGLVAVLLLRVFQFVSFFAVSSLSV